jgi:sortase A
MKLNIIKISLHSKTDSLLRCSQYLFFIIGILILSYCGYLILDAKLYQVYQSWRFQHSLEESRQAIGNVKDTSPLALPPSLVKPQFRQIESHEMAIPEGTTLGRIEIRAIGLTAIIIEGIEESTLQRAVGHFPGNPIPGQQGNVALAGHRDTFFRPLRNIQYNDEIILTTLNGDFCYRVNSTRVVEPEEIEVLDNTGRDILTLVTCYPFDFVGHAPKRFIVRAELIHEVELQKH